MKLKFIALLIIILLAAFLRFYKLDKVPPSLNWDEVAAAYNAYTIWHWGADEYGNKFPITFKSFGDDKHPVHIYFTAPFVGIFGATDYSARASSALIGVLSVIAIYFLVKKLSKSEMAGIFSALFLAVSPYHLQYSRGLWEANFTLFFLILGLVLFYYGIEKKNWMIPTSVASFGLSFFSYHSGKVVVPPVVLFLFLTHLKQLFQDKKILIISVGVGLVFLGLIIKDPSILGFARIQQNQFSESVVQKYGGLSQTYWHNYKEYFTYTYLFEGGDQTPRGSVKVIGEFYKIDMVLSIIGVVALMRKKKWEFFGLLTIWLLLSPIPGAVSFEVARSTRAIFMIGPVIIFSGTGAAFLVSVFKKSWLRILITIGILSVLSFEVYNYLHYYYTEYSRVEAIEWQYGMKQVVEYVSRNPDYIDVYMDKIRQQPYIFFLYYLKIPLPELLKTVRYDESESKSYNTVAQFDKYHFGGWDIIHSNPTYKVLYIMTPSYYSGLFYINEFNVNELIKYPNGNDAFYIVSGNR